MFDFTLYQLSNKEWHVLVYRNSDHRTFAEKTFPSISQAEMWGNLKCEELLRQAEKFANDPITRHYGL